MESFYKNYGSLDYTTDSNNLAMPVHRVAVLRPFTRFLTDIGNPVESGLRKAGLPVCALESMDNYVPSHGWWKFLVQSARSEGIPDLGFRVGEKHGADGVDPHMTELLLNALTLYDGFNKACELTNRTITHCQIGILQPPGCDYTYFYHRPSCEVDNPAIDQVVWFGLTTLLGFIRVYTGSQWQPTEIGFTTDRIPTRYVREHFPHTRMRLSQPFCYVMLENNLLTLPPLRDKATATPSSRIDYKTLPDDFVDSLETILLSYIQEDNLSIEIVAALCNTSKRSLQRKLKNLGTHYNELLLRARFRAASKMLQNPVITATEVALRLGYNNEANFSRAFRRIAGIGPDAYRKQFFD